MPVSLRCFHSWHRDQFLIIPTDTYLFQTMDLIRKILPHFRKKYFLKEHDYLNTSSVDELKQSKDTIDDTNNEAHISKNNTADIEKISSDDVSIAVPSNNKVLNADTIGNEEVSQNPIQDDDNISDNINVNIQNGTISNILGVRNSEDVIGDDMKLSNATDSQSNDSLPILLSVLSEPINNAIDLLDKDINNDSDKDNGSQIEDRNSNSGLTTNTTEIGDNKPNISGEITIIHHNNELNTEISKQNNEIVDTNNNIETTDQTVQGIIDFEEVLKSFHLTPFTNGEIINLDESLEILQAENDIFDNLTVENSHTDAKTSTNKTYLPLKEKAIDIDVISISSTEETDLTNPIAIDDSQYSSDNGYNSSDFEFITEEEAKKDGFIINIGLKNAKIEYFNHSNDSGTNNGINKDNSEAEAGPSGYNNNIWINEPVLDRAYRENHVVPIGDEYLNLFQGIYNQMSVTEICFWENKSIHASPMNWQYDGIGFDKQLVGLKPDTDSSEDEFADEAKENAEKILSMYSIENRKRRRRF